MFYINATILNNSYVYIYNKYIYIYNIQYIYNTYLLLLEEISVSEPYSLSISWYLDTWKSWIFFFTTTAATNFSRMASRVIVRRNQLLCNVISWYLKDNIYLILKLSGYWLLVRGSHQPSHETHWSRDLQKCLISSSARNMATKFVWIVTLVEGTPPSALRGISRQK